MLNELKPHLRTELWMGLARDFGCNPDYTESDEELTKYIIDNVKRGSAADIERLFDLTAALSH